MLASLNISLLPKLLSNCAKIRSKGSFFNHVGQNLPVFDHLPTPVDICDELTLLLKVKQSRNNLFKPTFPPKNEQTNSILPL